MLLHSSYSFPSEWVYLLELGLLALAALLLLLLPGSGSRWARRGLTFSGRAPTGSAMAGLFFAGLTITALTCLPFGMPVPRVPDEFSYLLAADTFAHGRLAHEAPAAKAFFATAHVLLEPVYASKYPPAQGLILAVGQLLGHPGIGLWLSAGALAAAVFWMLRAWVPPGWALLGGVLTLLRLGAGSYWNQSYWGGSMAAIGGALVFGALRRMIERPGRRPALALAAGAVLLANSRPYEGFLVALPAALLFSGWLLLAKKPGFGERFRCSFLPAAGALAVAAAAMLAYNERLTGDPWLMPYLLHEEGFEDSRLFVWEAPLETVKGSLTGGWRMTGGMAGASTVAERAWRSLSLGLVFLLGPALTLAALVGLGAAHRDRWLTFALVPWLLVLLGHGVAFAWWPHYVAPLTSLVYLFAVVGLRRIAAWRIRGRRLGQGTAVAALSIQIVIFLFQLPAHRPDAHHWSRVKERLSAELEERGGRHLVLVSESPRTQDWIYNGADLPSAPVIWARDLGDNEALFEYVGERLVWRFDGDELTPHKQPGR